MASDNGGPGPAALAPNVKVIRLAGRKSSFLFGHDLSDKWHRCQTKPGNGCVSVPRFFSTGLKILLGIPGSSETRPDVWRFRQNQICDLPIHKLNKFFQFRKPSNFANLLFNIFVSFSYPRIKIITTTLPYLSILEKNQYSFQIFANFRLWHFFYLPSKSSTLPYPLSHPLVITLSIGIKRRDQRWPTLQCIRSILRDVRE